ncbi:DUF674 family protein [Rhynchospora pubera]|uniref:DUF674 family protein n=1 Tax=Rhynchospora pubera TaxID=906938 RepID=A0AAV8E567_9POAL|nr:DUF674 family protein [Rhynchospora pubera]
METKSLCLNLTIDECSNKVLFAEADKDFVDVLLSFLTLPLGTLVRLSNKNSFLGLDNLYKSVEGLADEFFPTGTCREMLLRPSHAAEIKCLDLLVNVEGNRALSYYICPKDCYYERLTSCANAQCDCGSKMSRKVEVARSSSRKENTEGVFLKRLTRFIITDNFMVIPSSTQTVMNLLGCARTSASIVVEKQVNVGLSEMISILHQSLISENALTNVFLIRENDNLPEKKNSTFSLIAGPKLSSGPLLDIVGIKLIVDKRKNKVVYAECNQDFIDILFSFLTYPSGFVINKLNGKSHIACLDNLFGSVVSKPMADCFKTLESKQHLVYPRIPLHYRISKFLIKSTEAKRMKYYMCRTPGCDCNEVSLVGNVLCKCKRITNKRLKVMDPRSSSYGFVSDATYIVTDDLVVTPLYISTLISMIAVEDLVEVPFNVSKKEVLALLEAALGSQAVLTDAFLSTEETTIIEDDCVLV